MNENTTTKGEKMDRERIAELRRQYNGIWSEHRRHHPFGSLAHSTIDIRECLDALEAALARNAALERWKSEASSVLSGIDLQAIASEIGTKLGHDIGPAILPWIKDRKAHIARLEAALAEAKAGRVVPELTGMPSPTEWMVMLKARGIDSDSRIADAHESGVIDGVRRIGSRLTAIPASRVLRDGEARIGAEELAVLREVVRLVDEARERYDKRPRGADGQRMPDEIDDLLCRLYEIALHFRAQTTEGGV